MSKIHQALFKISALRRKREREKERERERGKASWSSSVHSSELEYTRDLIFRRKGRKVGERRGRRGKNASLRSDAWPKEPESERIVQKGSGASAGSLSRINTQRRAISRQATAKARHTYGSFALSTRRNRILIFCPTCPCPRHR